MLRFITILTIAFSLALSVFVGSAQQVTITFGSNFDYERFYDVMIERFEELHPDIKVEFWASDDNFVEQVLIQEAAGVHADVLNFNVQLARQGIFQPLDDFIARDPLPNGGLADFLPIGIENTRGRDGAQLAIPAWIDVWGIVHYQKQHFREAGLATPFDVAQNGGWTWDTLTDLTKKLTRTNGESELTRVGFSTNMANSRHMSPYLWSFGGEFYTEDGSSTVIDSPQSINALERIRSMIVDGIIHLDRRFNRRDISMLQWNMSAANIPVMLGETADNYDYIALPPALDGVPNIPLWNSGYGINRNSANSEAAWELIKFLSAPEQEAVYVTAPRGGALPARTSVLPVWYELREAYGARGGELIGDVLRSRTRRDTIDQAANADITAIMTQEVVRPIATLELASPRGAAENAARRINGN